MAIAMLQQSDLLMWKNPINSGCVLLAFNAAALFLMLFDMELTPFLCSCGMLMVVAGGAVKFAYPPFAKQSYMPLTKEQLVTFMEMGAAAVNTASTKALDVVCWKDQTVSIYALVALEVIRRVEPIVSLIVLAFICGNLLFVVPYLLEAKKDLIATTAKPLMDKGMDLKDKVFSKIPRYVPKEE
mmetsp:Transcript_143194/g.252749  ORF Transcript_143194/g.252749 Transcript_143194/m.252749 type:complete len:184 (+) Transcript_143194:87-638(+)